MRKLLIVSISLAVAISTSPAFAAAKAGAPCKKINATEKSASKSFQCVKSGKKLIWKAVATEPAAPTSFENLLANYKGIPAAAWKSTQNNLATGSDVAPPHEFIIGPKTRLPYEKSVTEIALKKVTAIFRGFAQPPKQTSLFYNYSDLSWATQKLEEFKPNYIVSDTFSEQAIQHCPSDYLCRGAFGNYAIGTGLIINSVAVPDGQWVRDFDLSGAGSIHEFTHTIQKAQFLAANNPVHWSYPHWFSEGQPQLAGFTGAYSSLSAYKDARLRRMDTRPEGVKNYSAAEISHFFALRSKSPSDEASRQMVYWVGFIAVEALAAMKGINSTMDLVKMVAEGSTFEQAFEKIYGTSWEKAEPILAQVVSKQFLEVRKNAPNN